MGAEAVWLTTAETKSLGSKEYSYTKCMEIHIYSRWLISCETANQRHFSYILWSGMLQNMFALKTDCFQLSRLLWSHRKFNSECDWSGINLSTLSLYCCLWKIPPHNTLLWGVGLAAAWLFYMKWMMCEILFYTTRNKHKLVKLARWNDKHGCDLEAINLELKCRGLEAENV